MQKHFTGLIELVEDQLMRFRSNADACITDRNLHLRRSIPVQIFAADRDGAPIRCKFNRVHHKMMKDLLKQFSVGRHERQFSQSISAKFYIAFLKCLRKSLMDFIYKLIDL